MPTARWYFGVILHYLTSGDSMFLDFSIIFLIVVVYVCGKLNKIIYTTSQEARSHISCLMGSYSASAFGMIIMSFENIFSYPKYLIVATFIVTVFTIKFPRAISGLYDDVEVFEDKEDEDD